MSVSLRHAPFVLIIRDGWGLAPPSAANAVSQAATPRHDELRARFPHGAINASEHWVGLPAGQMGNSEVGHLNIGAGRLVYQELTRIAKSIDDGSWFENSALLAAVRRLADAPERRLHVLGLSSDGGVHSHLDHLDVLLDLAQREGLAGDRVAIHAITDGRDTSPHGGVGYLRRIQTACQRTGVGRVASVSGRYYTMDRDKRWARSQRGWEAVVLGRSERRNSDPVAALEASYAGGVSDEFVEPVVIVDAGGEPLAPMRDGDSVIWLNFRADRARQLTAALKAPDFDGFDRQRWPQVSLTTLTDYGGGCAVDGVAFPAQVVSQHLGRVISDAGLRQRRIAETEKYAHVTWFFSGGDEAELPGETRCLVASPRVATYDLQPEMSAEAVAEKTVSAVRDGDHALLVVNFANPDMVGHTGDIPAAVAALEATDRGVGRIAEAVLERGGGAFITADHGNVEQMIDIVSGKPHTAHTTNPVEAIVVGRGLEGMTLRGGDASLADIAPTILGLMGLGAPAEMTGRSLLSTAT